MNARRLTVDPGPRADLLRILGGVLLATGALALFLRKANADEWGDFGRLLVLLVPTVLLYGLGLGLVGSGGRTVFARGEAGARPWQSALLVFAIFLIPLTLYQFLSLIDGSTEDSLNAAWIFAVTAALAGFAALRARVSFAALLAGIAALIAWLSFWDKVIGDPSGATFRHLLAIAAVLLLAAAVLLIRSEARYGSELITVAGIAAVGAGLLGAGSTLVQAAVQQAIGLFGVTGTGFADLFQQEHWNLFLLVVSLALILYGTAVAARGPTYVGAFGLFGFIVSVGSELAAAASGESPDASFIGWPLILILLGAAGLAAGFFLAGEAVGRGRGSSGGGGTRQDPGVPGATSAAAPRATGGPPGSRPPGSPPSA